MIRSWKKRDLAGNTLRGSVVIRIISEVPVQPPSIADRLKWTNAKVARPTSPQSAVATGKKKKGWGYGIKYFRSSQNVIRVVQVKKALVRSLIEVEWWQIRLFCLAAVRMRVCRRLGINGCWYERTSWTTLMEDNIVAPFVSCPLRLVIRRTRNSYRDAHALQVAEPARAATRAGQHWTPRARTLNLYKRYMYKIPTNALERQRYLKYLSQAWGLTRETETETRVFK